MIISDRDKTLTAEIFKNLMKIMNIQQLMGTSYEHRYNGAVEVLNKTIEVMLRHVMRDNLDVDFVSVLPLAQYCYNTSKHSTIKMSPYYALYGCEPRDAGSYVEWFATGAQSENPVDTSALVTQLAMILKRAKETMFAAQITMEEYQNRNLRDISFEIGYKVWLSTKNLAKVHFQRGDKKLKQRHTGPYEVLDKSVIKLIDWI